MHDTDLIVARQNLLMQAPLLVVIVVGLVVAGARWRRHPASSWRVVLALVAMSVGLVVPRLLPLWLDRGPIAGVGDWDRFRRLTEVLGIASGSLMAAAVALLLWAALGRRSGSATAGEAAG